MYVYLDGSRVKGGRRSRRGFGLGWTGGFTLPGSTTRYSQEPCTGSQAQPMTGGNLICAMPTETSYLEGIGCAAVGFRGEHNCSTDASNPGSLYCCPSGVLAAELARAGGGAQAALPGGIATLGGGISALQVAGFVGVAAAIGLGVFFLTRKPASPGPEEELFELEE